MKFSDSHEWVSVNGSIATVGVSDYAQAELGEIVYVELPLVGKQVRAGEESAVLESTKAAADVYTPLSGTIIEVNGALKEFPDLINRLPESEGWIFKVEMKNEGELTALKDENSYRNAFRKN